MDHYGIGKAIETAVEIYTRSARGSGRTTSLVESAKDGDRIVFTNQREANRVNLLCKERGVEVECIVVNPDHPHRLLNRGSVKGEGRNIFDHSWIEQFYKNAISDAQRMIQRLETETSGYGAAHRETRYKAKEMAKWQL